MSIHDSAHRADVIAVLHAHASNARTHQADALRRSAQSSSGDEHEKHEIFADLHAVAAEVYEEYLTEFLKKGEPS